MTTYSNVFEMPYRPASAKPKNDVRHLRGNDLKYMAIEIINKWLEGRYHAEEQKNVINKLHKVTFYFDMDGTCSEWDLNGNWQASHYFLHRYPIWNVLDAARILDAYGLTVRFGTCITSKEAYTDKCRWKNALGCENIKVLGIPYGANKDDYLVGDERVLLDDHTPNLMDFTGKGIKLLNGINHNGKKWQGHTIHKSWDPEYIVRYMLGVAVAPASL